VLHGPLAPGDSGQPQSDDAPAVSTTVGTFEEGFYVADDGPGIPAPDREAIFEQGYSTDSEGTGIGLSIVRRIVEAHGWRIEVTDSDAGGARFEFWTDE
jgi:signal transduction histidine kinase